MKKYILTGIMIALLLMLMIIPGCVVDEEPKEEPEGDLLPITVVDDMGNDITINKYPQRIASLSPSSTEILYELGIGDRIIAVDSASNYPEEASNKTVVFSYTGLMEEKFLDSDPDIVIMSHRLDLSEVSREWIKDKGYSLVILDPEVIEDVMDNIELLGKLTGREEKAKTLMNSMESRIDDVEKKGIELSKEKTVKVLYVIYYDGTDNPWVAGRDTYIDDFISKSGAQNVITGFEGNLQVSSETIIDAEPDIIICSQNEAFPTPSKASIENDAVLKSLDAVENDQVHEIDADLVDRPGPRIVDGLEIFQEFLLDL
jgi:iron complex transport system substrate-binding protein